MKQKKFVKGLALFFAMLLTCGFVVTPASAAPSVSARSAVLIEAESGRVLYQQNAFLRLPMASTTKIMTAIVAIESGDTKRTVAVSPDAVGIEGSSVYLYPGEQLTMEELLYALLLESANDAATAIAIAVAGSVEGFSRKMNEKAESLGLTATHFTNPHGLDDEAHYTTAYDLAVLSAYALKNEAFRTICATTRKTIPLKGDEGTRVLVNHNKMLTRYEGAIGVKTGFTKRSGRCLVSAAERDGLTLIAVTLGAPDDWRDHAAMLDFGFESYQSVLLAEKGGLVLPLSVVGGDTASVLVANTEEACALLGRKRGEITYRIEAPQMLYAPVASGDTVGRVVWMCDGEEIGTSPLATINTVAYKKAERKGLLAWLTSLFDRE